MAASVRNVTQKIGGDYTSPKSVSWSNNVFAFTGIASLTGTSTNNFLNVV